MLGFRYAVKMSTVTFGTLARLGSLFFHETAQDSVSQSGADRPR